ncbi:MAG: MATE family efflux transporter [Terrimicrobiaceae bacterium]|nr:MATE family efflux transporter [Terrimicrobiaceae bacterium]
MKVGRTLLTATTSYGSAFSLVLTGLLTIRLATRGLGAEAFGAWSYVFSTIGFFFLFDLGLPSAMARIFGEPMASRNGREVGRWSAMCVLLMAGQAVLMLAAGWFLRDWVLGFSNVTGPLREEMVGLWNALLWIRVLSHPASVLPALLFAQNRVYVQNIIYAVSGWLSVAGFYLAMEWWKLGLMAYAVSVGVSITSTVLMWVWAVWRGPVRIPLTFRKLPWSGLPKALKFSSSVFVSQLAVQATALTQNVIIAAVLGLEAAAIFAVTSRLPAFLATFAFRPFAAFAPRWQEAFCRPETRDSWKGEYLQMLRFSGLFAAAAATGLVAANLPFVAWWTKPEFAAFPLVNVLLAGGVILTVYINCSITVFHNHYQLGGMAMMRAMAAVVEIGLGFFFAHSIGLTGIPLAMIIPNLFVLVYAYRSAGRLMGERLFLRILRDAVVWVPGLATATIAGFFGIPGAWLPDPFGKFAAGCFLGGLLALPAFFVAGQILWRLKHPVP